MHNKFGGPVPDTLLFGGTALISFIREDGYPAVLVVHGTLFDQGLYLLSLSKEHVAILPKYLKEFYVSGSCEVFAKPVFCGFC